MKPLEDQLRHSQRTPQRLSAAERSDMLKTIMAAQPSLPEIHESVRQRMPWKWSILLLPVGGFALLVAFIVSTNSTNTNQLANTNTTKTLPEISNDSLLADTTGIVPVYNYQLSDDFLGGGNSITGFDFGQWDITYSGTPLTNDVINLPIADPQLVSNSKLMAIAERIPGNWTGLELTTEAMTDNFIITTYSTPSARMYGLPDCTSVIIENSIPCLQINSTGRIVIAHIPSETDPLSTALGYIATITQTRSIDWLVRSSLRSGSVYDEYDIFPKQPIVVSDIPVRTQPWHVVIDAETKELRGVLGTIQHIAPMTDQMYEIVSEKAAYSRFMEDLDGPLGEGETFTYTTFWYNEFFPGQFQADDIVELEIKDIQIEYRLATPDDSSLRGIPQYVPVYRLSGIDTNTEKPFEAFVNGAVDQSLLEYSL